MPDTEPFDMRPNPALARARDDCGRQPAVLGGDEVLRHALTKLFELAELELAGQVTLLERGSVVLPAGQGREEVERVERLAERTDVRDPFLEREVVAMLPVDLLPRAEGGSLGVDEEPVEVEEEPASQGVVEDVAGCTSRWTCWPLSWVKRASPALSTAERSTTRPIFERAASTVVPTVSAGSAVRDEMATT